MTDAIRVKALEWKKSRLPGEENILCAESPFGVYRAHVYNSFCRASLDYRTIADFAALPTLEEAKAACQADFARRVGECVDDVGNTDTISQDVDTGWRGPAGYLIADPALMDESEWTLEQDPADPAFDLISMPLHIHPDYAQVFDDLMESAGTKRPLHVIQRERPLPPPPGEEVSREDLRKLVSFLAVRVEHLHDERDTLQARYDKLEAATREACDQLKSLAYASHKATGRPLSKRPRTKILQRPEKVRDNLLAVRKALRSALDGGE